MAVDQNTITNAGLDPLTSLQGRIAEQTKRQSDLGQQQMDIGKEQERLTAEKIKAQEPIRQQMLEESQKTPGAPPKEEMAPSYQRPTIDPKQMHDTFGVLMAASMLVGAASRQPFFDTMGSMTGAMNGFMAGDKAAVDESMKEYDKNLASIKERNAARRREFEDAWNKHGNDMNALRSQLEIIGAKYDDPMLLQAARSKSITDAMKVGESNLRNMEQAEYRMEMLNFQMKKAGQQMGKQSVGQQNADEAMAWDYLIRGHNPPAMGGAYGRTMAKVEEIAKREGMSVDQLISASADVKARLAARRTSEVRIQNLERAENQLALEIPVMQDAMKKINAPSIPIASRGKIAVLREMGDPNIATLDQAATTILNEFEGIVTGNPGTLNVSDVEHAKETYKNIQTPQQMQAWIDGAHRIIANAKAANEKTRKEFLGGVREAVGLGGEGKVLSLDEYLKSKGH